MLCEQDPANRPARCTCAPARSAGDATFRAIPAEFIADGAPLWKLPQTRNGLWEAIFRELAAGDGAAGLDAAQARCGFALGREDPAPLFAWVWELPEVEARAFLTTRGAAERDMVGDLEPRVGAYRQVRGEGAFSLGPRGEDAASSCALETPELSADGRCELLAPSVRALTPRSDEGGSGASEDAAVHRLALTATSGTVIALVGSEGTAMAFARSRPLDTRGALSTDQVREAVVPKLATLRECTAARQDPVAGRLNVRFVVGGSGRPGRVGVTTSSLEEPELEACISAVIARWVLPEGSRPTRIRLPLEVAAGGGVRVPAP